MRVRDDVPFYDRYLDLVNEFTERLQDTYPDDAMSDMLTSNPAAYGTHAEWLIHDCDGRTRILYQAGPGMYVPKTLIEFVWNVASLVMGTPEFATDKSEAYLEEMKSLAPITSPGGDTPTTRRHYALRGDRARISNLGPLCRELCYRFPELNETPDSFARRKRLPKVAQKWEVWAVGRGDLPWFQTHPGCEIAFQVLDKDGAPDPNFTFDRSRPQDLLAQLAARDKLRDAFKL